MWNRGLKSSRAVCVAVVRLEAGHWCTARRSRATGHMLARRIALLRVRRGHLSEPIGGEIDASVVVSDGRALWPQRDAARRVAAQRATRCVRCTQVHEMRRTVASESRRRIRSRRTRVRQRWVREKRSAYRVVLNARRWRVIRRDVRGDSGRCGLDDRTESRQGHPIARRGHTSGAGGHL